MNNTPSTYHTVCNGQWFITQATLQDKLETILTHGMEKTLYTEVIANFASYVQGIPSTLAPFNKHGGLLELSLQRACAAVEYMAYVSSPPASFPVYHYAVFTASLLYDIGSMMNWRVMACSDHGAPTIQWNPLYGTMSALGIRYYRYACDTITSNTPCITLGLAMHIIRGQGFSFLSQHAGMLTQWIHTLLADEQYSGETLYRLVYRLVRSFRMTFHSGFFNNPNRIKPLIFFKKPLIDATSSSLEHQWLTWLRNITKKRAHPWPRRSDGVYISNRWIKAFLKEQAVSYEYFASCVNQFAKAKERGWVLDPTLIYHTIPSVTSARTSSVSYRQLA
jgi:hypothetical protein